MASDSTQQPQTTPPLAQQATLARIDQQRDQYLEELKEYLRIPSVSTDPAFKKDVRRCAEFLLSKMIDAGLDAKIIEASEIQGHDETGLDGHPLVYAEWLKAPGKPTVLFYGHYDVQPPDPLDEWRNPPFEPTVEGDHLVARGATDDKGQSYCHLKAVEALLQETGELPVNVKFIVEGEEESGGETLEAFVRSPKAKDLLKADCVMVSDSSMLGPGQPSLLYGLRGMAYMEVEVLGPNRDLHSGSFGGAVRNPGNALATIIAGLSDPATGKIMIPGFYDQVRPLEEWERQAFGKLDFDETAYKEDLEIQDTHGEDSYSTRERAWARPTCDVNGMWSGYQGAGAKTIIPATAGAKVSMRLVPDQQPEVIAEAFRQHVEALAPSGVRVEVRTLNIGEPVLVDVSGPAAEAAMKALEQVWGTAPVTVREGGSIPIVGSFADVLEVPVLLMGLGLSDDRLHSPNEKFNISHYYQGIRTVVSFLERYGRSGE